MMQNLKELEDELCFVFGETYRDAFRRILAKYSVFKKEQENGDLRKEIKQFVFAKKTEGLSNKTLNNYLYILDNFSSRVEKNARYVKTDDVREYISYLFDFRQLTDGSVQTYINTLRSFFSWLLIEQKIKRNPMLKIKSMKIDKKNSRKGLTLEELEKLRDACTTYREKAIIETFVSTGCRLSELIGVQVEHVNFSERSMEVLGKGGKLRTVYFSVRAKVMLETYLSARKNGITLFSSTKSPYNALSGRTIQNIIKGVGQHANLSTPLHPHLLRHTFASQALERGMDITIIQQILGHEDISTTQIYTKVSRENIRHEYNKYID